MTDQTSRNVVEFKPWWASKTIWAAVVAGISAIAALIGHNINAGTQAQLINQLSDIANMVAILASVATGLFRAISTAKIKPLTGD